jgi:hypothetical protein
MFHFIQKTFSMFLWWVQLHYLPCWQGVLKHQNVLFFWWAKNWCSRHLYGQHITQTIWNPNLTIKLLSKYNMILHTTIRFYQLHGHHFIFHVIYRIICSHTQYINSLNIVFYFTCFDMTWPFIFKKHMGPNMIKYIRKGIPIVQKLKMLILKVCKYVKHLTLNF